MAYQLTNLLQDVYRRLGQTNTFVATGGSNTTIENSLFQEIYDDDSLKGHWVFVTRVAASPGSAPEGEYKAVASYVETTGEITISGVFSASSAVTSGDTCTLVSGQFPVPEMIQMANIALKDIGEILLVDVSITTAANQTEYTYPVGLKKGSPVRVYIQGNTSDSNDNDWEYIDPSQYDIVPASPGQDGLIIFKQQYPSGRTIKIIYNGLHPTVNTQTDSISETIPQTLAVSAVIAYMLEWYNTRIGGSSEWWLAKLQDARREFEVARQRHPLEKVSSNGKLLILGSNVKKDTYTTSEFYEV